MEKPVLLVTRRMPQAVEARAGRDYEARLTASDTPIPDLLARAQGTDAILTCPGASSRSSRSTTLSAAPGSAT